MVINEKELLASDYMSYYIFQRIYDRNIVTTQGMDIKRFVRKLNLLEQLNLTYSIIHRNYREIITEITDIAIAELRELRYIGGTYTLVHNILSERQFNRLNEVIHSAIETIKFKRNRALHLYLDVSILRGYGDLKVTEAVLDVILRGIELVEYICNSHLKELNKLLPSNRVTTIIEKGYTGILLESLDK